MCLSAGPLHLAGGGDGRHGAGNQHERDRGPGRGAEPHGEVRGRCAGVFTLQLIGVLTVLSCHISHPKH